MKINILTPEIYNLLSAGEVVENPASVVKELCENAIDAGATRLIVEITDGGITEIVVTDNGDGCPESELQKVFMPHSTSKIKTARDIASIMSLGFRGEAMASICAVSKVEFLSKQRDSDTAFLITNADNKPKIAPRAGHGTTVTVSNIFYNTPARRKFLKSATSEKSLVTAVIHDIIFSNPKLSLKYIIDGVTNIDFRGSGVADAIRQIYHIDATTEMLPVSNQNNTMQISGFISKPTLSKNNKTSQIVIINGRVIGGGVIADAVNSAMSDFLMTGVYPVFVLDVNVDTTAVDVNVHPQKREVRFDNPDEITKFVKTAITQILDEYFLRQQTISSPATPVKSSEPTPIINKHYGHSFNPESPNKTVIMDAIKFFDTKPSDNNHVASAFSPLSFLSDSEMDVKQDAVQTTANYGREWEIVGSVFDTYLLIKTQDELIMIDQHAAHERINYDNFKSQCDKNNIASQILLDPVTINLTPGEMLLFEKANPHLSRVGFEISEFGDSMLRVLSIPQIFTSFSADDFMHAILTENELQSAHISDLIKDKIALMACKASIRAGEALTHEQIESFLSFLQTKSPIPLCPHGRPILITLTKSKIEGLFGRKV